MLKVIKGKHLVADSKTLFHIHLSPLHFFLLLYDSYQRSNRKLCDPEEDLGIPGHLTEELEANLHPRDLSLSKNGTREKSREEGREQQAKKDMR